MLQLQTVSPESPRPATAAHVIVVGNEKGGAGKSTLAMHLSIALMLAGRRVAVMDLDVRQQTLTRYLENRRRSLSSHAAPMPYLTELPPPIGVFADGEAGETARFATGLARTADRCDILLIDAPGADTLLGRLAHAHADTLITPLNDSFVDFDLLADIDPNTNEVIRPGVYAEMVWESRKRKAAAERRPIDWVVMRNRMAHGMVGARNTLKMTQALQALATRIGFRLVPGLSERVIFRELFPQGSTLLDLGSVPGKGPLNMSHVAARQELRDLLIVLKLPGLSGVPLGF